MVHPPKGAPTGPRHGVPSDVESSPQPAGRPSWVERLARLASLDRAHAVFGSDAHRHLLPAPAPEQALRSAEARLGVRLPEALRRHYAETADGGAGPGYGMLPVARLVGLRPDRPYPGVDALRALARAGTTSEDPDDPYFEVDARHVAGLVGFVELGCGHLRTMVVSGPSAGRLVDVSNDGYVEELGRDLHQELDVWVDGALEAFDVVLAAVDAGLGRDAVARELTARLGPGQPVDDLVVSLAGLEKPPGLFGSGGARRYGGAEQARFYRDAFETLGQARGLPPR